MPLSLLVKLAKKHKLPLSEVEDLWTQKKEIAKGLRSPTDPEYYPIVVGLLKQHLKKHTPAR